jgi:hypothetical protein
MKIRHSLVLLASFIAIQATGAQAQIIFDSLTSVPSTINLDNIPAFAFYGDNSIDLFDQSSTGVVSTDVGNLADFTGVELTPGSAGDLEQAGPGTTVTFNSSQGSVATTTGGSTNQFAFVDKANGATAGVTITSTLFAPVETFSFYVTSFDTKTNLTASLSSGATFSLNDQVLPGMVGDLDTNGHAADGSGNASLLGDLTLTVTGSVGDVLTFSISTDPADHASDTTYENVGIDVATVPEPSTFALLLGGVGLMLAIQRFRKIA